MDVLLVGAYGTVGTAVLDELAPRKDYEFTCLDVETHPEYDTHVADITDYDNIRPAFEDKDAVIQLARQGWSESSRVAEWFEPLAGNLEGITNVYASAVDAGVEAFAYASSNSAVGMYEHEYAPDIYRPDRGPTLDHTVPVRPDSMYGLEKVYGEALGRYCADREDLRVAAIRIGNISPPEYDYPRGSSDRRVDDGELDPGSEQYRESVARQRCVWQSRRDFAGMVDGCLRTESYDYEIFYGVSDNSNGWFDIDHARDVIGYDPRDSGDPA